MERLNHHSLLLLVIHTALLCMSRELGSKHCVTLETFNNILRRASNISSNLEREIRKAWKPYELIMSTSKGLKLRKIIPSNHRLFRGGILMCLDDESALEALNVSVSQEDVEKLIKQFLELTSGASSDEKLVALLHALFTLNLNSKVFSKALACILNALLPDECQVKTEFTISTGARCDVYLECSDIAIAFEVKSPSEGTRATASHNPVSQALRYVKALKKQHKDKHVAAILIRTDGKTPLELILEALLSEHSEAKEHVHVLSKHNLEEVLGQARRIAKEREEQPTAYTLLKAIATGAINTLKLEARILEEQQGKHQATP